MCCLLFWYWTVLLFIFRQDSTISTSSHAPSDRCCPSWWEPLCGLSMYVYGWTFKSDYSQRSWTENPALIRTFAILTGNNVQEQAQTTRCTITDGTKVFSNEIDSQVQRKPIPPVKSDMIWFHASHKEKGLKRSTMFATKRRHFHRNSDTFYKTLSTA